MDFFEVYSKLSYLREFAEKNYVPIIREQSSKILYDFVKKGEYKNILEIGTAIGYSGSMMLLASGGKLTTIDKNPQMIGIARETFENMGLSNKVNLYCDDAYIVIEELLDAGSKYDMIFLDGAKGQYIKYLPILTELLEDNGVIFADNVLLQGMVESEEKIPHRKRTMVVNLRKYLNIVACYPYETEILHIEDGIAITKVKR